MTMVSCPCGMTAPVKMRAAVPGAGLCASWCPAAARPSTGSSAAGARIVVAGGERKAVDGGIGVRGDRMRRARRRGQDAAGSLRQLHRFGARHRPDALLEDPQRLVMPHALLVVRKAVVEQFLVFTHGPRRADRFCGTLMGARVMRWRRQGRLALPSKHTPGRKHMTRAPACAGVCPLHLALRARPCTTCAGPALRRHLQRPHMAVAAQQMPQGRSVRGTRWPGTLHLAYAVSAMPRARSDRKAPAQRLSRRGNSPSQ